MGTDLVETISGAKSSIPFISSWLLSIGGSARSIPSTPQLGCFGATRFNVGRMCWSTRATSRQTSWRSRNGAEVLTIYGYGNGHGTAREFAGRRRPSVPSENFGHRRGGVHRGALRPFSLPGGGHGGGQIPFPSLLPPSGKIVRSRTHSPLTFLSKGDIR